jgi:hypothetical protein
MVPTTNQVNVAAGGSEGDGTGLASNRDLKIALQALAFQLAWDIVMTHLVPGYMMQKAITLAEGFSTNPLAFMHFFFLRQQVLHAAWRPSSSPGPSRVRYQERCHLWNPADGGFATPFARMAIIWDLGELPTGKARRSQRRRLQVSAFVKFQHLRNSIKAAGQQCKRMIFHQQLRGFLKEHPDLTGLTEKDLDKFETTCSSEKQDQRAFDSRWVPPVQEVPRVSTPAPEVQRMGYTPSA